MSNVDGPFSNFFPKYRSVTKHLALLFLTSGNPCDLDVLDVGHDGVWEQLAEEAR